MCVCECECVCVCVRACVRACVRVCVRACVCVSGEPLLPPSSVCAQMETNLVLNNNVTPSPF